MVATSYQQLATVPGTKDYTLQLQIQLARQQIDLARQQILSIQLDLLSSQIYQQIYQQCIQLLQLPSYVQLPSQVQPVDLLSQIQLVATRISTSVALARETVYCTLCTCTCSAHSPHEYCRQYWMNYDGRPQSLERDLNVGTVLLVYLSIVPVRTVHCPRYCTACQCWTVLCTHSVDPPLY